LENHESLPSSSLEIIVVSLDLYGLVSNSCKCLVICNKDVSASNSNPGLVTTRGVNFWDIMFRKSGPDICLLMEGRIVGDPVHHKETSEELASPPRNTWSARHVYPLMVTDNV
jgi:hypothetical protein